MSFPSSSHNVTVPGPARQGNDLQVEDLVTNQRRLVPLTNEIWDQYKPILAQKRLVDRTTYADLETFMKSKGISIS